MGYTAITAYVLDQVFGYQSANALRLNIEALLACMFPKDLGGSRSMALPRTASALDAIDYRDIDIDDTDLSGLEVHAKVEVRTTNAATSITPKIRNITDGADAVVGASCTATNADYTGTNQKQDLTLTLTTGLKKYRLQATPGDTNNDTFAIGNVYVVPA